MLRWPRGLRLLGLPLLRGPGTKLVIGGDEAGWKAMLIHPVMGSRRAVDARLMASEWVGRYVHANLSVMEPPPSEITVLLERWSSGDESALHEATRLLYSELRVIAASYFRTERKNHTLQPTALIHETYLRLVRIDRLAFDNRKQFLALVAKIMRQILVDHARELNAFKRGSGAVKVELSSMLPAVVPPVDSFLILDDALTRLHALSERQARVIELRYFGGLGVVETGEVLGISAPTVSRDQRMAEAWLNQELRNAGGLQL